MAKLRPIVMFHGRHFVRHLGSCNPICVKLLQIMSGVIPRNLNKTTSLSKPFFWRPQTRDTHTQAHTDIHDNSRRRNAMCCISSKNARCRVKAADQSAMDDRSGINTCTHTHTHTHTYIHTHTHIHTQTHTHTHIHTQHTPRHAKTHTHTHTYIYIIYIYIRLLFMQLSPTFPLL